MARFSGTGIIGRRRGLSGWRMAGALIAVALPVVIALGAQTASGRIARASHTAGGASSSVNPTAALTPLVISDGVLAHRFSGPPTSAACENSEGTACYSVQQMRYAYGLLPLLKQGINGRGTTIVVVDPLGSQTIASDLKGFDKGMGLPNPPSLKVIRPAGRLPKWLSDCGKRGTRNSANCRVYAGLQNETTMDVEWSHAMAPAAKIVLVETPIGESDGASGFNKIIAAENYVINRHIGQVITQSFGATEQTFTSRSQIYGLRSAYVNAARHGVTVLAASGDTGATGPYCYPANRCANENNNYCCMTHRAISWPASDPLVTAVGGTRVMLNASGQRIAPDTVWNDFATGASGGGLSTVFKRPAFQNRVAKIVGDRRGIPDISMSASSSGAVSIYVAGGWTTGAGTSLASPLFAGIVALADQEAGRSVGYLNPLLYKLGRHAQANGIVPITSGNNSFTFCKERSGNCRSTSGMVTVKGFTANGAYNDATGLGTIDASKFVPALAKLVDSR